jgi:hypothetical protein
MAIHAKKISQGSTFITADSSITDSDLQLTLGDGSTFQATVSKIERVINFTGSNISVAGVTFAPGDWDFSHTGGYDIGTNSTAVTISGGMVTLRT